MTNQNTTTQTILTSTTAKAHGWGSDPFKWVSGLTDVEKTHVKSGGIVLVPGCPPCGGGNGKGCTTRRVKFSGGRFVHRCSCGINA